MEHLHRGAADALGSRLVAFYVEGSLALGDFDPSASDLDVVVVTEGAIGRRALAALGEVHCTVPGERWRHDVEASYLPRASLRRFDPGDRMHPRIERGPREVLRSAPHDEDWIVHRHVLREHGIVIAGPAPETLIDPVTADQLRGAVGAILRRWWAPMLEDPAPLRRPGYAAYAVLTACRALHTLETGTVVSKRAAARWGRDRLPPPVAALVESAQAASLGAAVRDAQAMIRLALDAAR